MQGEEVLRLFFDEPPQEREVPKMLARLVALVTDVLEKQIGVADRLPLEAGDPMDRRHHPFVHSALKTDAGVVPPQPVLPVGGHRTVWPQQHSKGDLVGTGEEGLERRAVGVDDPLVGIDVENPLACRAIECDVSSFGEVIVPLVSRQLGAVATGNRWRAVHRPGVDHHDLVDNSREGTQAVVQDGLFVSNDQHRGDEHRHRLTGVRPSAKRRVPLA